MDGFKPLRIIKRKESDLKKEKGWNDRFFVKESHTPNKISQNKSRIHIKIKSRDIKNINLNNITEDETNSKININTNISENKTILPLPKPKLKPNKTLNNLLNKLHKKEQKSGLNNHNNNQNGNNNSEIYTKIVHLWDELGVNYIYQSIFNKISLNLTKEKKEIYYNYEYNRLNNIYNIINLIIIDIDNREKIIVELQKHYYINGENEDKMYDEEIIKKVLNILINIRQYSIDIINNIILLRKEIGYDLIMNKFDLNKIFIFPNDYLIKMNNDLDFLINSPLNKYFNFSKSDPFITKINNNNNKYKLPELKEENIISLINNYENIFFDELEVNLNY